MAVDPEEKIVEISAAELSPEALHGLVVEFVTRDGTDYGSRERSVEEKVSAVLRSLERGEVRIVFELGSGSANLLPVVRGPGS